MTKWEDLTPGEKKIRSVQNAKRKAERAERDKFYKDKRDLRDVDDKIAKTFRPGDWMQMREGWGDGLAGKIVRFKEWDDDGYNDQRAPRNLKVIVEIEPHLNEFPVTQGCKLGGFRPANEMEVIAEAAR